MISPRAVFPWVGSLRAYISVMATLRERLRVAQFVSGRGEAESQEQKPSSGQLSSAGGSKREDF